MAMQKAIDRYLDAVEAKFGADRRNNTQLKHSGGMNFILKRGEGKSEQSIDLEDLLLMTKHLQSS